MSTNNLLLSAAFACGISGALVSEAALQPLLPAGPTVLLTSTTSAADPSLAGTVIEDTDGNFIGAGFSGTFRTRVVERHDTGTLDFYYRINSFTDAGAVGRVLRDLRISDYVGFTTAVTWRPDGLPAPDPGEEWAQAVRFPQPQCPACDGINLSFANLADQIPSNFVSGEESYFVLLRTNATEYKLAPADVYLVTAPTVPFDQFLSELFQVYVPAVPEPATCFLALGACVALLPCRRVRHR